MTEYRKVEENNETRTSTVLNNDSVQLRYLGNIENKNQENDNDSDINDTQIKRI